MQERLKQKKKKPKYFHCSKAQSEYQLLTEIMREERPNWKFDLNPDNCDVILLWHRAGAKEIRKILSKRRTILNRYPNIKTLSHKDTFQKMMAIACDQDAFGAYNFVPRTFLYPRDKK